jgi:phage-related protein
LRRISQIFSTDKPSDLVFDENPYKTYRAKLKSKPELKYICFEDRNTKKRVYKGEATFNFICYHPLAYCFNKYVVRAADFYKCTMP